MISKKLEEFRGRLQAGKVTATSNLCKQTFHCTRAKRGEIGSKMEECVRKREGGRDVLGTKDFPLMKVEMLSRFVNSVIER
jgi:hypothetical protein